MVHAGLLGFTYMSPLRVFFTTRATYRTRRYADEANRALLQSGWDGSTDFFWETYDKRFRVRFSTDNLLHKEHPKLYTLVLVWNF